MNRLKQFIYIASMAFAFNACGVGNITKGSDDNGPDGGGLINDEPFKGEAGTILFVTQVPIGGLDTIVSHFTNHMARVDQVPRGGDLMIRYPDGSTRNLTREAGFGDAAEMQGVNAIAVRQPSMHWSGNKAIFSMAIGSVTEQFSHSQNGSYRWQMYEATGLGKDETVKITKVADQPEQFNNISPIYGSDDRILFVSDSPPNQEEHLYPQLDEYESEPVNTGIWSIVNGRVKMIEHSPSGAFHLSLDHNGRVIFTKWDHLQRDQMGDGTSQDGTGGVLTYSTESAGVIAVDRTAGTETFPEARTENRMDYDSRFEGHTFNHFYPWQINQDGTEEETLNHIGRQEWGGSYTEGNYKSDSELRFERQGGSFTTAEVELPGDGGAFFLSEDPTQPNWFLGIRTREFGTGNAGSIIYMEGDPEVNPEQMKLQAITPATGDAAKAAGKFRNPIKLSSGTMLAVHTQNDDEIDNTGTIANPDWNYDFRIKELTESGALFSAGASLTEGFSRTVSWYTPDQLSTWSGTLWELDPVEVAPRKRPPLKTQELPEIEDGVFSESGVDPSELSEWLQDRDLALVVSRDVTRRDRNDVQQPFNLSIPGGVSASTGSGDEYDISRIQFFQGDLVRTYADGRGRRPLARPMHANGLRTDPTGPEGSVALGSDGSFAAFVPARRALSWQLTAPDDTPVVRERVWVSFAPGEIRVCASCHGINEEDQLGEGEPTNEPEALKDLLADWKADQ